VQSLIQRRFGNVMPLRRVSGPVSSLHNWNIGSVVSDDISSISELSFSL